MANAWEQRKLGDILILLKDGTHGTHHDTDSGPLLLSAKNIKNGTVQWDESDRRISKDEYENIHANFKLKDGDVLLTIVGSIGETAILKNSENVTFQRSVAFLRPSNELKSEFLYSEIQSSRFQKELNNRKSTSAQPGIYLGDLGEISIDFPKNEDEQYAVSQYFCNLDSLITLHQRKAICTKNVRNNHILSIFLWERAVFMGKMILYHGSPNKMIHPIYGLGEDKHDYGRGFYLTAKIELAKEWAVCRPDQSNGWVHKYELVTDDLRILDFQQLNVLSWLAELMKHREASDSKRYRMLAAKFIEKYGIDTDGYDVIKGWRADASYFYIAKAFVRDEIDVDILEELLFLGDLGIQYCIKSEKGYANLHELESELLPVSFADFNDKYNERDIAARENMRKLIDSDDNKVTKVFSTLI